MSAITAIFLPPLPPTSIPRSKGLSYKHPKGYPKASQELHREKITCTTPQPILREDFHSRLRVIDIPFLDPAEPVLGFFRLATSFKARAWYPISRVKVTRFGALKKIYCLTFPCCGRPWFFLGETCLCPCTFRVGAGFDARRN